MAVTLYQPEKYNVFLGRGSAGLCTVWNEPELIFNRSAVVQEKAAIVGTLYSRQGINIILRNLALNPQITTLIVWGNGTLSNTQFGVAGKAVLEALWQNGLDADGTINGTQFKIEKEIDPAVVEKIRTNVTWRDLSTEPFEAVEAALAKIDSGPAYMEAVSFPDHETEAVETFPSEIVGWLTRGRTIMEAWSRVVDRIMRYGVIKGTQYGYQQRELIGVTWVVTAEDADAPNLKLAADWPETLRQTTGATADALTKYFNVFLSPEAPAGLAYTYGNRLMRYPSDAAPIDQIEEVLKKQLRDSPDSRRAVATTMVPAVDKDHTSPPCITQVQALQTDGALHFLVTARSHDIFKAAIPNAFGLRKLQQNIARDLGFSVGALQITSQSAHIYEQDWEDAFRLARCQFWEREPSLGFNPETQADPRGNLIISLENGQLHALLQGPRGEELTRLSADSAKALAKKIAQLELLSRSDHIFDIALELQKAELALSTGKTYRQDQPFIL